MPARLYLATLLLATVSFAQTPPPSGAILSTSNYPQAAPADVDSIDHILAALYDVISGPAHQPRNWQRMRSLFVPGARLIPTRAVPGTPDPHTAPAMDVLFLSIDDYIARSSKRLETDGFYERAVHNETVQFGAIAHIFSTYESRHAPADPTPFARGINSIQLLKDGGRYWIVDVYWDAETPEHPLPAKYLPGSPATSATSPARVNQYFTGDWVGQLQYRDYSNDQQVFLPTWLTMTPSADGRAVTLAYTYDDGPTKTVRDQTTLTLDSASSSATFTSATEPPQTYAVAGFETFLKANRGTLVLTGKGTENKQPVDVRITLALRRNLFTLLKETRPPGTPDYKFRDTYTFTRTTPPAF